MLNFTYTPKRRISIIPPEKLQRLKSISSGYVFNMCSKVLALSHHCNFIFVIPAEDSRKSSRTYTSTEVDCCETCLQSEERAAGKQTTLLPFFFLPFLPVLTEVLP